MSYWYRLSIDRYKGYILFAFICSGEPSVISGESGAVTLGALELICTDEALAHVRRQLEINEESRILLISTEGDTDPDGYRRVVRQCS